MANDKNYTFIIHEIKNNITLLQSSLQLMKKNHPEIQSYEEWNSIDSAFSDLSNIFHNITDKRNFSELQLEAQTMHAFFTSFETRVKQLCSNAEISAPIFEHSNPDTTFSVPVSIHAPLLERALINLVQNAIDSMKNSTTPSLLIRTYYDNSQFCISITDNGIGMSNEIQKLMYTPSFTTKGNGLGLGLCIVKEIVTAHHGTLLCDSVPNKGTTFTILLPATKN